MKLKSVLSEVHLLLIGLLYQEDPPTGNPANDDVTLDPIRLLLLTFSLTSLLTGRFQPIVIALITAHLIGRFLAALRDGTIKAKNDP